MERELKFRLPSREAWEAVRDALGPPRERLEQTNWYFGPAGPAGPPAPDGKARDIPPLSVRVREEAGRLILSVKLGRKLTGAYFETEETEAEISPAEWADVLAGRREVASLDSPPARIIAGLACRGETRLARSSLRSSATAEDGSGRACPAPTFVPQGFRPQGSVRNLRLSWPAEALGLAGDGDEELLLDATSYPDGSADWEIEFETDDPAPAEKAIRALLLRLGIEPEPQEKTKHERFLERSGG